MLVRRGAIMLADLYHLTARKFPSVGRNMHLLFATFCFGHLQHLLPGQVAQAQESKQAQVGVTGRKDWLAPVPPPKGKCILCHNTGVVNPPLLSNRRWWGRIGTWFQHYIISRLRILYPSSRLLYHSWGLLCK